MFRILPGLLICLAASCVKADIQEHVSKLTSAGCQFQNGTGNACKWLTTCGNGSPGCANTCAADSSILQRDFQSRGSRALGAAMICPLLGGVYEISQLGSRRRLLMEDEVPDLGERRYRGFLQRISETFSPNVPRKYTARSSSRELAQASPASSGFGCPEGMSFAADMGELAKDFFDSSTEVPGSALHHTLTQIEELFKDTSGTTLANYLTSSCKNETILVNSSLATTYSSIVGTVLPASGSITICSSSQESSLGNIVSALHACEDAMKTDTAEMTDLKCINRPDYVVLGNNCSAYAALLGLTDQHLESCADPLESMHTTCTNITEEVSCKQMSMKEADALKAAIASSDMALNSTAVSPAPALQVNTSSPAEAPSALMPSEVPAEGPSELSSPRNAGLSSPGPASAEVGNDDPSDCIESPSYYLTSLLALTWAIPLVLM